MTSELSSFRLWNENPLVNIFLGSFGAGDGACRLGSTDAEEEGDWGSKTSEKDAA